jgi:hypothetical protein
MSNIVALAIHLDYYIIELKLSLPSHRLTSIALANCQPSRHTLVIKTIFKIVETPPVIHGLVIRVDYQFKL